MFNPGDKILFKAGSSWGGQLSPQGSGSSGNPITIDMYGTGDKPIIAANGSYSSTVYFVNQEYWELSNLEVTNTAGTLGDYRGISINGRDYGTLNHFHIGNCYIHDVTGEVKWISSSGWDLSKKTGGIVFDIQTTAATPIKTKFDDVLIENCMIKDCSFGGIILKQWQGTVLWGDRSSLNDSDWYPHTNVIIRNNYLSQYNTENGCNTIYVTNVQGGTIENNVCAGAGTCAIELYNADNIIVQKNETYDTVKKAGGADYNGIDADHATTNIIIQYNYSHDNGDGILLCSWDIGSVNVRYNILQNNSRYGIYLHNSDTNCTANIYNNIVYSNKSVPKLIYGYGKYLNPSYVLQNNIFYATQSGATFTSGGGISYDYNCYYGSVINVPTDTHMINADPKLVDPGKGSDGSTAGTALGTLDGYKLQISSSCINGGVFIANNGGKDFWGNQLYNGSPDIGVHEY